MSEKKKGIDFKRFLSRLTVFDYIAIAVFLGAVIWYCLVLKTGIAMPDESFYYTITKRLTMGDNLFVDEWQVSQLSSILQYIPYRLYTLIAGSTQGVIVFMRAIAGTVALVLYWFVYIKLRKHRLFAVLIAFPYAFWFPGAILTLSYYTLPFYILIVVYLILFMNEKPLPWWKLVVAGLLYSCVVLAQPIFAIVYFVFSILCLVHRLKPKFLANYDFALNAKLWKGVTLGCLIAFVVVVGAIAIKGGVANIMQTIPELFTDSEYEFSSGSLFKKVFAKLGEALKFYGIWTVAGAIIACVFAAVQQRSFRDNKNFKAGIFISAGVLFAVQIIYAFITIYSSFKQNRFEIIPYYFYFFSIPTALFGLTCYLLCEKKNPRIFVFWVTSFFVSVLCTFTSEIHMSICGPLNQVTMLLCLKELWDESVMKTKTKSGKKKAVESLKKEERVFFKSVRTIAAISVAALICWCCYDAYVQVFSPSVEVIINRYSVSEMNQTIEKGPHKGIKTTAKVKEDYENTLADLDTIYADSDGKALYVATLKPACYLYLDLPIGTYSTWYVEEDSQTRQLRYWELHPEKKPKYCYIPYNYAYLYNNEVYGEISKERADEKLAFYKSISDCTVTKGRAGYIVKIEKWK